MKALFVLVFVVLFSGSAMAEGKDNETRSKEPWGSMIEGLQYNMGIDIGYILALDYVYKNGIDKAKKELCNRDIIDIMVTVFDPFLQGIRNISAEQIKGINIGLNDLIHYKLCNTKDLTEKGTELYTILLKMVAECKYDSTYNYIYDTITEINFKLSLTQMLSLMKLLETSDCKNKTQNNEKSSKK